MTSRSHLGRKARLFQKIFSVIFGKYLKKWLPKICNWVFRVELSLHRACWCHVYHQISCSDPFTWRVHILTSALNGRHWAIKISKGVFLKLNVCILIPNSLEFISIDQITLFMLRLGPSITRTNAHHVFQLDMAPWASYQIRKIAGCACAGNAGNVFPATDFKGNR